MPSLTELGSGIHDSIVSFPGAELPNPTDENTQRYNVGTAIAAGLILRYLSDRSKDTPIVDTTDPTYHNGDWEREARAENQDYA